MTGRHHRKFVDFKISNYYGALNFHKLGKWNKNLETNNQSVFGFSIENVVLGPSRSIKVLFVSFGHNWSITVQFGRFGSELVDRGPIC